MTTPANRREFLRSVARMGLLAGLGAGACALLARGPGDGTRTCVADCRGCRLFGGCTERLNRAGEENGETNPD